VFIDDDGAGSVLENDDASFIVNDEEPHHLKIDISSATNLGGTAASATGGGRFSVQQPLTPVGPMSDYDPHHLSPVRRVTPVSYVLC